MNNDNNQAANNETPTTTKKSMGWKKATLIGIVSVGVLGGAVVATAASKFGDHAERVEYMRAKVLDKVSDKLTLDATQQQAFENFTLVFSEKATDFRANKKGLAEELKTFVVGERFDRIAAQTMMNNRIAELTSAAPQVIESMATFYDGLDTTQQALVREQLDKGLNKWGRHGKRHGDRHADND